jgi:hypothetical protein
MLSGIFALANGCETKVMESTEWFSRRIALIPLVET